MKIMKNSKRFKEEQVQHTSEEPETQAKEHSPIQNITIRMTLTNLLELASISQLFSVKKAHFAIFIYIVCLNRFNIVPGLDNLMVLP